MMNKTLQIIGITTSVVLMVGCQPADTGSEGGPNPSPTIAPPINTYNAQNYASALRSASIKLRAELPDATDTAEILNAADPRIVYEAVIDGYMDPNVNTALAQSLADHFKQVYLFGDKTENVTHMGTNYTVNFNEPANLLAYLIVNEGNFQDMLTADYCVDDNFNSVACDTNVPVEAAAAGFLTNTAYLRTFGKAPALNYQLASVTHQFMECGIYPDGSDAWLARSNTTAPDPSIIPLKLVTSNSLPTTIVAIQDATPDFSTSTNAMKNRFPRG